MSAVLERAVRIGWYPGLLGATMAAAYGFIAAGASPGLVVAGVSLGLIPVCVAMERLFPETPRWQAVRGEVVADLLHMTISNPVPALVFRALFFGGIVGVSQRITDAIGTGIWPTDWPLAAQAALAIGVAEFVNYWIHRGLHESRLWPLHAVHHSSPRMYFLLSMRKHPLQAFLMYGARLTVLWLLGVTNEALALYTVLVSTHSYLQHSNVRMTTGPMGWIFATPELHRLHHSSREDELDANYGDALIVWDVLFGTRRVPDPERPVHDFIGLPHLEVPQTWRSHLALPFRWSRLHAGPEGPA